MCFNLLEYIVFLFLGFVVVVMYGVIGFLMLFYWRKLWL